jgi:4-aminobutyrate aminotransferase
VAAALAVLDVMAEEQLPQRAKRLGDQLLARLNAVRAKQPRISDVRGLGAMVACEFADPATGNPDPDFTKRVQQAALKKGLLLLTCGVYANVIRFLFPLTIEDAVFAEALDIIDGALGTS